MRKTVQLLKRAGREFGKNLLWLSAAFSPLTALVIFATSITLLGALPFLAIFVSVMAALVTVLTLVSSAHDETLLSGHKHHPGAPPDRSGDWADGGSGDGGSGGGGW
jgi:hypothetical protein